MEATASDSPTAEVLSQELFLSSLVHDVTRVLLSAAKLPDALHTFLLGAREIAGAQRVLLLRVSPGRRRRFAVEHAVGLPAAWLRALRVTAGHGPVAECLAGGLHQWVETPQPGDPFSPLGAAQYLLMPVTAPHLDRKNQRDGGECIALLWIDTSPLAVTPAGGGGMAQAISHLSVLCRQAGLVIENFRVRGELTLAYGGLRKTNQDLQAANHALERAQKRLFGDLEHARQLQAGLLPRVIPSHTLRDFASRYVPAGQVGGDYYDCFETAPGRLDLVIADVSGHGMAAALVMTMFKVLLKTLAPQSRSPARTLERIHRAFLEDLDGRHFVTVFYAVFDVEERTLTYCSAGHVPQFLVQTDPENGETRLADLPSHGLVLGMFPNLSLSETRLEIGPRARLVLYTDGISEAHGPGGMFGTDRLRQLVAASAREGAEKLGVSVMRTLEEFRHPLPAPPRGDREGAATDDELSDDMTLAILDL